jgi:hypothetical protein
MNDEIVKISKAFRPLHPAAVLSELKNRFPEFEVIPAKDSGAWIAVKKSTFAGARIEIAEKEIRIRGDMPDPLSKILNAALLGTISAAKNPPLVRSIKKFLQERYRG